MLGARGRQRAAACSGAPLPRRGEGGGAGGGEGHLSPLNPHPSPLTSHRSLPTRTSSGTLSRGILMTEHNPEDNLKDLTLKSTHYALSTEP